MTFIVFESYQKTGLARYAPGVRVRNSSWGLCRASRGANPGTDSQFPANCAGNSVSVPGSPTGLSGALWVNLSSQGQNIAKGKNQRARLLYTAASAHQSRPGKAGRNERSMDHGAHRNSRAP